MTSPKEAAVVTPKQKVLKRFPCAISHSWADCWNIYSGRVNGDCIGVGKTAALAWANACAALASHRKGRNG